MVLKENPQMRRVFKTVKNSELDYNISEAYSSSYTLFEREPTKGATTTVRQSAASTKYGEDEDIDMD